MSYEEVLNNYINDDKNGVLHYLNNTEKKCIYKNLEIPLVKDFLSYKRYRKLLNNVKYPLNEKTFPEDELYLYTWAKNEDLKLNIVEFQIKRYNKEDFSWLQVNQNCNIVDDFKNVGIRPIMYVKKAEILEFVTSSITIGGIINIGAYAEKNNFVDKLQWIVLEEFEENGQTILKLMCKINIYLNKNSNLKCDFEIIHKKCECGTPLKLIEYNNTTLNGSLYECPKDENLYLKCNDKRELILVKNKYGHTKETKETSLIVGMWVLGILYILDCLLYITNVITLNLCCLISLVITILMSLNLLIHLKKYKLKGCEKFSKK